MRVVSICFIAVVILSGCETKERAVSYYENGNLKHQVLLKDGEPDGLAIVYFENGKVKSKTHWKEGKFDGESIVYFENGNIFQRNFFKNGVQCDTTKIYTEDGFLKQIGLFDSLGRVKDYFDFKNNGVRNFSHETKKPLFLEVSDTVNIGTNYSTEIRLGNRQFNYIDVFIGNIDDIYIMKDNPPLPKKDSITSVLEIKADSLGKRKIEGVILERNKEMQAMDVIPFRHYFYVKPKSN